MVRHGPGAESPLGSIKDPWAMICEAAGLKSLRLHDLRHAFASAAVKDGLSPPLIASLLAHRETRRTLALVSTGHLGMAMEAWA
jgi:integrase